MPYVPSKKTDGKSTDREILDVAVEEMARLAATVISSSNLTLIKTYKILFSSMTEALRAFVTQGNA